MGCNNSRNPVISELSETRSALVSKIEEMEEEKIKISSYLNRFSSEETMVGIDLFELKDSLSDRIDDTLSLAKEIQTYPEFISEVNTKHQNLMNKITSFYTYINSKYSEIHRLKIEKLQVVESNRILAAELEEAKNKGRKLRTTFEKLEPIYSSEENYIAELESLIDLKKDLENDILDCHKNSLSINKENAEKKVNMYNAENAAVELNRVMKRNKTLVSSIEKSEKKMRSLKSIKEEEDKLRKVELEYMDILNQKKERIMNLKNHLFLISNDMGFLKPQVLNNSRIEDKGNSLEKIIESCSKTPKPEIVNGFKNYIKGQPFINEIESSVARARTLINSNL